MGEVRSNGDVYVNGTRQGEIRSNGDVYIGGVRKGEVRNLKSKAQAACLFFYGFFSL